MPNYVSVFFSIWECCFFAALFLFIEKFILQLIGNCLLFFFFFFANQICCNFYFSFWLLLLLYKMLIFFSIVTSFHK
jgi:hypothetical protein